MNYSANDNLEVMKVAKNYNGFLVNNVLKIIKKYNCKKLLDFGCADGFFIKKILNLNPNVKISGVECDDDTFLMCLKAGIEVKRNINEFVEKFDLIYSFNVLEHIEDDVFELIKMNNFLSENGKLFLYLPAMNFLYSSMDEKVGHYRRYDKKEIIEKLQKANFKIEQVKYCDCIGVIATLLYKFMEKFKKNHGDINKFQIKVFDFIFPLGLLLDELIFSCFLGKNILVIATKI